MDKVRLRIMAVLEYDADPQHYEGCETAEQMAQADLVCDPFSILCSDDTVITIEVVEPSDGQD